MKSGLEMKRCMGIREVKACPMNLAEYSTLRGRKLPAGQGEKVDGYLLESPFGAPNHDEFDGPIRWVPAAVFKSTHRCVETARDRVVLELDELNERLDKLTTFVKTFGKEEGVRLSEEAEGLLRTQVDLMQRLRDVLVARLQIMSNGG